MININTSTLKRTFIVFYCTAIIKSHAEQFVMIYIIIKNYHMFLNLCMFIHVLVRNLNF